MIHLKVSSQLDCDVGDSEGRNCNIDCSYQEDQESAPVVDAICLTDIVADLNIVFAIDCQEHSDDELKNDAGYDEGKADVEVAIDGFGRADDVLQLNYVGDQKCNVHHACADGFLILIEIYVGDDPWRCGNCDLKCNINSIRY